MFELKSINFGVTFHIMFAHCRFAFNKFTKLHPPVLHQYSITTLPCWMGNTPALWYDRRGFREHVELGVTEIFTLHWLWTPPPGVTHNSRYHTVTCSQSITETSLKYSFYELSFLVECSNPSNWAFAECRVQIHVKQQYVILYTKQWCSITCWDILYTNLERCSPLYSCAIT